MSSQRLTAFLALQDRPVERSYASGTLWPEAADDRAAASLRSALWRIQQAVPGLVGASRRQVHLGSMVAVDVRDMLWRTSRGAGPSEGTDEEIDPRALADDLLPDWYEDWVVIERERIRQARLHVLEALCLRLAEVGRFAQAVQAGLAAVAGEPLRESAQRALIMAYLAEGNLTEAVRQHTVYRRLLREELGVEPSPAMDALVRR